MTSALSRKQHISPHTKQAVTLAELGGLLALSSVGGSAAQHYTRNEGTGALTGAAGGAATGGGLSAIAMSRFILRDFLANKRRKIPFPSSWLQDLGLLAAATGSGAVLGAVPGAAGGTFTRGTQKYSDKLMKPTGLASPEALGGGIGGVAGAGIGGALGGGKGALIGGALGALTGLGGGALMSHNTKVASLLADLAFAVKASNEK